MKPTHLVLSLVFLFLMGCASTGGLNLFSLEQDVELGKQLNQQILNSPSEYPILRESSNRQAYSYLQGMVNEIVRKGNVPYTDVFPYKVTIIDQDVKNAFATAGGYIYVYTGLIKFLDSEDQLAGVLAHEIAHAAERHVTEQATKQYGLSTLLSVVAGGDPGALAQIGAGLIGLRFSRGAESEADARSVDYLCGTRYAADGTAGFFAKTGNSGAPPEFLSTHPSPSNRVEDIRARAAQKSCPAPSSSTSAFRSFQRGI